MVKVDFIRKDSPIYDDDHIELTAEIHEDKDYIVIEHLSGTFDIETDEKCYVSHQSEFERTAKPESPVKDVELINGLITVVARDGVDFPDWDELAR